MNLRDYIESDKYLPFSNTVVKGSGLPVEHVIKQMVSGWQVSRHLKAIPG